VTIEDLAYEAWKAETGLEWGREYFDEAISHKDAYNNTIPHHKELIREFYHGFKAGAQKLGGGI
jgi:hypothetical protein